MSLRNAFANLALDTTVASIYSWLQARLGSKTKDDSISVSIASDQVQGDAILVTDGGLLGSARESFDSAYSALDGMVLQEHAIPDPSNPLGPALQVTMRDPIQLDSSVAAVTGGIDPTGAVQRTKVGVDGGTQLTDCKQFFGSCQSVNTSPIGWIDTTGYQSIVVSFVSTFVGTITFQTSNDLTNASNASGYSVASGNAATSTLTSSATSSVLGISYVFPTTGKFFRVQCTGYTSGTVSVVVTLRSAPFVPLQANATVDITRVSTTAVINNTPGSLSTNGVLRPGYQFNAYNPSYGPATQTLTSQSATQSFLAPITIGGLDGADVSKVLLVDTMGAAAVTSAPSSQSEQSIQQLLLQILATLRASAYYQYELAHQNSARCVGDEPDNLIGDFLEQAAQYKNFIN